MDDDMETAVRAFPMFSVKLSEALGSEFESPLYAAVNTCDPTARVVIVKVACPLLIAAAPSGTAPSSNVTVPVGITVPLTAAEKTIGWPKVEGFAEEPSVMV